MSSIFNKSNGISLASVLGNSSIGTSNSNSNGYISSNSVSKLKINNNFNNQTKSIDLNIQQNNNNTSNNNVSTLNSTNSSSSSITAATTTTTSNNINSQLNQTKNLSKPLSNYLKTIDNCLEEATRTGDLLLSNKSLIEYPSTIAFKYDLTDTLTVDLSKNRLGELPKDVLRFKPLEKLILNANIIRLIPEINTNHLKCIKILDLNYNRLTYLPSSLCNLVSLEILTVNNNKLVSLPEEIGRLEKLIQLDVSCNEITHLPIQMGEMTALRSLNVRRNLLVELPKELSQLKLVSFDCTSNRINKLPLCFREMVTLIDLFVENNPLEVPPAHVCTKGLLHIMKYLLVEAIKEDKKRGILTEYETNNTHFTSNETNNQRSSCNSSNGMGSIGSFLFQNSVRNMCKKYSDTSSTTSSTESTSSSVSSSNSNSAINHKNKQQLQSSNNILPIKQELISKSINSISSASSNSSTMSSNMNQNNITSKQNMFLNNADAVDFTDAVSQSLTSSPSSSSASSSPPILAQQQQQQQHNINKNLKSGSIHELLSLKTPAISNNMSNLQQQQPQMNYTKCNKNNSDVLPLMNEREQNVWRLTESRALIKHVQEESEHVLKNNNKQSDTSYSIISGLSSTLSTPLLSNNNNINSISKSITNTRRLTTEFNGFDNNTSQMRPKATPIPVIHQQNYIPSNEPEPLIYDESLNPINPLNYKETNENPNDHENEMNRYYTNHHHHQQQQQQIWVPRNEISNNDNFYTQNHFTPVQAQNESSAFTIRRHLFQIDQEQKQIETLKKIIESRLKIDLPETKNLEEFGSSLADGVVLCHLINHMYPRAIQMIHLPSLSMPKLPIAKCRKNVENFVEACHRLGIDEIDICSIHDINEGKNLTKIARTVEVLVNLSSKFVAASASATVHEYRPQTIGSVMSATNMSLSNLQIQPHQQQTAV